MLAYYHGIAVTPEITSLGCQCTLFKVILGTKLDAKKSRFSKVSGTDLKETLTHPYGKSCG